MKTKENIKITANTKTIAKMLILTVVSFGYGFYMISEYIKAEQDYFSRGNLPEMMVGMLCIAAGFYGAYLANNLRNQYIEIENGAVTGVGLEHGFFMKGKPFSCSLEDIQKTGVVNFMNFGNCVELRIRNQVPVTVMLQDPKAAAIQIMEAAAQKA